MNLLRYRFGRWWRSAAAGWMLVATLLLAPLTCMLWLLPSSEFERLDWSPWWPRMVALVALAVCGSVAAKTFFPEWYRGRERSRIYGALRKRFQFEILLASARPKPPLHLYFSGNAGFDMRLLRGTYDGLEVRLGDTTIILNIPLSLVGKGIDWVGQGDAEEYMEIRLTYAFAPSTAVAFPRLLVRGENILDRAKGLVGMEDIDFESHEFSKMFFVRSEDRRFAYDILTPQVMELLMQNREHSVLFDANGVVVLKGTRLWDEPEFEPSLRLCTALVKAIPPYVWDRYAISRTG